MRANRQNLFPLLSNELARSFSDEPILIDGMKLQFDEKVALYPVTVEVQKHDGDKQRRSKSDLNGNGTGRQLDG